jgi:hypothetical protein
MSKRVLIVSPHFPPTNAADMHRVRSVLPFLCENGWQAEVLAVSAECVAAPFDDWLAAGIPGDICIHRAQALSLRWSGIPGLGTLDMRAWMALRRLGNKVLAAKKFDLIYFSTTVFGVLPLSVHWKRQFGIPFVVDYQDPWLSDYYHTHPNVVPPGGRLKYWVVNSLARRWEPQVLARCSGITSVSPAYLEQLRERYPNLPEFPIMVAPFPGSDRDFQRAHDTNVHQSCFDPHDGKQHWIYVGAGGAIMRKSTEAFFASFSRWRRKLPNELADVHLHFIGTSYAPAGQGRETIKPLSAKFGLEDCVEERTDRIRYSEMLKCLVDAHALIVPGSDDATYNASKLFPYLLARKPILLLFHEASPVTRAIKRVGGTTLVTFDDVDTQTQVAERIGAAWFARKDFQKVVPIREEQFAPFTDHGHARQLSEFFDTVIRAAI